MAQIPQTVTAREIAEEAWRMLTDEAKESMKALRESYIASLEADIEHYARNHKPIRSAGADAEQRSH